MLTWNIVLILQVLVRRAMPNTNSNNTRIKCKEHQSSNLWWIWSRDRIRRIIIIRPRRFSRTKPNKSTSFWSEIEEKWVKRLRTTNRLKCISKAKSQTIIWAMKAPERIKETRRRRRHLHITIRCTIMHLLREVSSRCNRVALPIIRIRWARSSLLRGCLITRAVSKSNRPVWYRGRGSHIIRIHRWLQPRIPRRHSIETPVWATCQHSIRLRPKSSRSHTCSRNLSRDKRRSMSRDLSKISN